MMVVNRLKNALQRENKSQKSAKNTTKKGWKSAINSPLNDKEITNICKSQNVEPDDYLLRNKFLSDLYRRVGNKVIKYAKDYDYKMQRENKSEAAQRVERAKGKAERKKLLKRTLQLKRQCDYEATEAEWKALFYSQSNIYTTNAVYNTKYNG